MTDNRLRYMIEFLSAERGVEIDELSFDAFRALANTRPAMPIGEAFLKIQDAYLQERLKSLFVTDAASLGYRDGIALWQGDITALKADAIVNAANSGMTGCYCPCHGCIDNCIHTFAGVQLRLECAAIMQEQAHTEPTGQAKLTKGYNLPCQYILHTVGPIVQGALTNKHRAELRSCYRACLALAAQKGLQSVAFCCVSTGEYHFPNREAARIAIATVKEFLSREGGNMKVIFNVYKDTDLRIYRELLGADRTAQADA